VRTFGFHNNNVGLVLIHKFPVNYLKQDKVARAAIFPSKKDGFFKIFEL